MVLLSDILLFLVDVHVAYLEPSWTCMMGVFEKIGNGFK